MMKKEWNQMSSAEIMSVKIDEIYDRLNLIENLLVDLSPAFGRIAKEVSPTIKDLREVYERDETLTLVKKAGENIPTLLTLLDLMESMKGLVEDLKPAVGKISKEIMPSITMLRESFEKDEALELIQKTGENINTFSKLMSFLTEIEKSGVLDFTLKMQSEKETQFMIKGMQKCMVKTMQEIIEKPPKPGLGKIFSVIRDPEVQKGILILTAFARNLSVCLFETTEKK